MEFWRTFGLVMNMIDPFKKQGYHIIYIYIYIYIYMDNFYSSLILILKLRVGEDTLATGTLRPRKGIPKEV